VLLACNANGSNKLPSLISGKYKSPHCFKNVKRLPTKYEANTKSLMTTNIFEDYLTQQKTGGKNHKFLLFIDRWAAYPKNTTFLRNIRVAFHPANCTSQLQPLDLGIIHVFKFHYRKQLIHKNVAMIEGGLLQDATQMKLYVLSAKHFITEAWRSVTSTTIKNCFVKCGFSTDHVSSNVAVQ
jgi:hypothetical protein